MLKFDYFATLGALQVIVLWVAIIMFVKGAGSKFEPAKKAGIDKFIKGTIGGCPADFKAGSLHIRNKGLSIKVIVVAENKANHVSLLPGEALGFIASSKIFPEFIFGGLRNYNRLQVHG